VEGRRLRRLHDALGAQAPGPAGGGVRAPTRVRAPVHGRGARYCAGPTPEGTTDASFDHAAISRRRRPNRPQTPVSFAGRTGRERCVVVSPDNRTTVQPLPRQGPGVVCHPFHQRCNGATVGVVAPGGPRERRSHNELLDKPCWNRYDGSQRYRRTSITSRAGRLTPSPPATSSAPVTGKNRGPELTSGAKHRMMR
jgi:hypothetical protein